MEMSIRPKADSLQLLIGAGIFFGGLVPFAYLMEQKGHVPIGLALARLLAAGLMIGGIAAIWEALKYSQQQKMHIKIQNGRLYVNKKPYSLDKAYITLERNCADGLCRVTLRIEKEDRAVTVFENAVLDQNEWKTLKEMTAAAITLPAFVALFVLPATFFLYSAIVMFAGMYYLNRQFDAQDDAELCHEIRALQKRYR